MIVPEKTIAVVPIRNGEEYFDINNLSSFIRPLNEERKREWFSSLFYKCLPLSIGNLQGFAISLPFDFDVSWSGGDDPSDISFSFYDDDKQYRHGVQVGVSSHFGYGIFTISLPVMLKTPTGINLMTISPPNFLTPGMNTMTGVVEADNLRFAFTVNVKINIPNISIHVPAHTPLAAVIPIPRYFCDEFSLINAYDIIDKDIIEEEISVGEEHNRVRHFYISNNIDGGHDRTYFFGSDIRGNRFPDHQLPTKKIKNS